MNKIKLRAFILHAFVDTESMGAWLDQHPIIRNWYGFLPNCFLIASEADCGQLAAYIRSALPTFAFVLTEVDGSRSDGYFAMQVWEFLNNPKDSGRHPTANPAMISPAPYSLIPPAMGVLPSWRAEGLGDDD